jgi:hypothetical protein
MKKFKYSTPSIRRSAPGPDLLCADGSGAALGNVQCDVGDDQATFGCVMGHGEGWNCGHGPNAGNDCVVGNAASVRYSADGCSTGRINISCGTGADHVTLL